MTTTRHRLSFAGESYDIECFADDFMERRLRRWRPYEWRELEDLHHALGEASGVVVDVGANIGNHALAFSRMGFSSVVAFEMMPETADLLERNLANSCRVPSRVVRAVVTDDQSTVIRLKHYWKNRGSTAISDRGPVFDCAKSTLDVEDLQGVTLLKIDVEGHEAAVVRGAANVLSEQRPVLMIEIWQRHIDTVRALLAELGYVSGVRMRGEFGDNYVFTHPRGCQLRSPIKERRR